MNYKSNCLLNKQLKRFRWILNISSNSWIQTKPYEYKIIYHIWIVYYLFHVSLIVSRSLCTIVVIYIITCNTLSTKQNCTKPFFENMHSDSMYSFLFLDAGFFFFFLDAIFKRATWNQDAEYFTRLDSEIARTIGEFVLPMNYVNSKIYGSNFCA